MSLAEQKTLTIGLKCLESEHGCKHVVKCERLEIWNIEKIRLRIHEFDAVRIVGQKYVTELRKPFGDTNSHFIANTITSSISAPDLFT